MSLLRHSHTLVNIPPETITWCHREWQRLYSTFSIIHPNLECVEDLQNLSSFDSTNRNLVVIDDLMSETDRRVRKLFTKKSHHYNTSVIYLVENLFPKGESESHAPDDGRGRPTRCARGELNVIVIYVSVSVKMALPITTSPPQFPLKWRLP